MPSRLSAVLLCAALVSTAAPALADSSVVQSWRGEGGWMTELRKHADGALVCTTAKAFSAPRPFGLSLIAEGAVTLLVLVDQAQAPTAAGTLAVTQQGTALDSFAVTVQGPAWATAEADSARVRDLLGKLRPDTVSFAVDSRSYEGDLAGIGSAATQLAACEAQAAKGG